MKYTLESVCRELRLNRIPNFMASIDESGKEEWLLKLLIHEVEAKERRRLQRLIKQAKFPSHKTLESFEWHSQLLVQGYQTRDQLTSLDFIRYTQNDVCIGAPGTGKTHLASALGYKACQAGIETRFWRVSDLVLELENAWKENQLERFKKKFNRVQLIILDEMGYVPFHKNSSELFFQLISDWLLTSSRNRHFLLISFPQILLDKIRHLSLIKNSLPMFHSITFIIHLNELYTMEKTI